MILSNSTQPPIDYDSAHRESPLIMSEIELPVVLKLPVSERLRLVATILDRIAAYREAVAKSDD